MKTGGTLFNNLLDGNEEMFVFPDLPYFRLLTQRQCISDKHLVMDWILGSKFIGQYPEKELSNFDREDEYTPIPQEYIDLAFSKIRLKGHLRGIENWQDCFSFDVYHKQLINNLEKMIQENAVSEKNITYQTVLAAIKAVKNVENSGAKKAWSFRSEHTPSSSLTSEWKLQNNYIKDYLNMFPEGKVIFTVRGPQALMASRKGHLAFVEQRAKCNFFRKLYYTIQDASITNNIYEMIISYLSRYGSEHVKVIRYEDFCADTEKTMRNVCEFIGISFSPMMTSPTIINQSSKVVSSRKIAGDSVDKSRLMAWKEELTKFEIILVESFIFHNRKKIKELWGYEMVCSPVVVLTFRWFFILPLLGVLRVLGWVYAKTRKSPVVNPFILRQ